MSISSSICAEISAANNIREDKDRDRKDIKEAMRLQGSGDNNGRSMCGSYTHVGVDTAKDKRSEFRRVSKRKEFGNDIRKIRQHEVQVRESEILV